MTCSRSWVRNQTLPINMNSASPAAAWTGIWISLQVSIIGSSWIKHTKKIQIHKPSFLSEAMTGLPKATQPWPPSTTGIKPEHLQPLLPSCSWASKLLWKVSDLKKVSGFESVFFKSTGIFFLLKKLQFPLWTISAKHQFPYFLSLSDSYQLGLITFSTESSPAEIACCCS